MIAKYFWTSRVWILDFEVRRPRCVGSKTKNFCVLHIESNTTSCVQNVCVTHNKSLLLNFGVCHASKFLHTTVFLFWVVFTGKWKESYSLVPLTELVPGYEEGSFSGPNGDWTIALACHLMEGREPSSETVSFVNVWQ